jgi:dTDP-4-dehydrorhamnose 3,5-epimerase
LPGEKDPQLVQPDWTPFDETTIEGVEVRPIKNVLRDNGYLTEIFRPEWEADNKGVAHVFQRVLNPGAISAWHVHRLTTDRLFCAMGSIKLVLFDARVGSPTVRRILETRLGHLCPSLVVVPPGVYHGVKNIGTEPCVIINAVDKPYSYEDPDQWRVPLGTDAIDYQF